MTFTFCYPAKDKDGKPNKRRTTQMMQDYFAAVRHEFNCNPSDLVITEFWDTQKKESIVRMRRRLPSDPI